MSGCLKPVVYRRLSWVFTGKYQPSLYQSLGYHGSCRTGRIPLLSRTRGDKRYWREWDSSYTQDPLTGDVLWYPGYWGVLRHSPECRPDTPHIPGPPESLTSLYHAVPGIIWVTPCTILWLQDHYPVLLWDPPLDADRCEESYSYEVPGDGREGPEEVLPEVGLLQGEVLVGLQAGCHLRQRIGVTLMEGLFPEVLILEHIMESDRGLCCCVSS